MLYHLLFPLHDRALGAERHPLHHVPDGRGEPHGARRQPAARAVDDPHGCASSRSGRSSARRARRRTRAKAGTPTMGGLLILTAALVPTLLWADLTNVYIWIAVSRRRRSAPSASSTTTSRSRAARHHGLIAPLQDGRADCSSRSRVGVTLLVLAHYNLYSTRLIFPFFKWLIPDLGWLLRPVCRARARRRRRNAVNLTDGLDGLAISTFAIVAAAFTALAYVTGHRVLARLPAARALRAGRGADDFLRRAGRREPRLPLVQLRIPPRSSWATSARSRSAARSARSRSSSSRNCCSSIVGGVFVLEALSVIMQVASFKLTGQRVFRMAPLHHHFELIGWSEPKVITRFVILGIIFALLQPDDAEAEVTARWTFSVEGRRVLVVGAARSGVAAAELLARRGAHGDADRHQARASTAPSALRARASRSSWAATTRPASPRRTSSCRAPACRSISRRWRRRARRACPSSGSSSWRRAG